MSEKESSMSTTWLIILNSSVQSLQNEMAHMTNNLLRAFRELGMEIKALGTLLNSGDPLKLATFSTDMENAMSNVVGRMIATREEYYQKSDSSDPSLSTKGKGGGGKGGKLEVFDQLKTGILDIFRSGWMNTIKLSGGGGMAVGGNTGIGGQLKGIAAPFMSAFAQLGPQMAATAIVMKPIQSLLEGLLEPFEMINDYFGAFGEILGQIFLPIMQVIQPLFDAFIPILQALVPPLADVLLALFNMSTIGILINIITPLLPLIVMLAEILGSLMSLITPFLNIITDLMNVALAPLMAWVTDAVSWLGTNIMTPLNDAKATVDAFFDMIFGWAERAKQGGADKNAWTFWD